MCGAVVDLKLNECYETSVICMPPILVKSGTGMDAIDVSVLNLIRRIFNKTFFSYFSLAFGKVLV